jgi:hypothetical protein
VRNDDIAELAREAQKPGHREIVSLEAFSADGVRQDEGVCCLEGSPCTKWGRYLSTRKGQLCYKKRIECFDRKEIKMV